MATLVRWEPYREMISMRRLMDQMFDDMYRTVDQRQSGAGQGMNGGMGNLEIDVSESEEQYKIKASMPGVNAEDIDLAVNGDMLTISGETHSENESDQDQYHIRERRAGSFSRTIGLPSNVDPGAIDASCENGVLTITLPKTEETKPRRISVKGGNNGSQTIDATTNGSSKANGSSKPQSKAKTKAKA